MKSRPSQPSPIWKKKTLESADLLVESSNGSTLTCTSPVSTLSSDHDNMSLQSLSSESNSGSLSNRISSNSIELQQQALISHDQIILQGNERLENIRNNEIYRRRCYRAGLNVFNKYVNLFFIVKEHSSDGMIICLLRRIF